MPCSIHSLNLCSVHASIERLYTFSPLTVTRWEFLSSHVKVTMKCLVTIRARYKARYKAIRAVKTGFQGVIQGRDLLTSASEHLQMRRDAQIILLSIENISFMSYFFDWEEILGQINLIPLRNLITFKNLVLIWMCNPLGCVQNFLNQNWDMLMSESVNQNKTKYEGMEIPVENQSRRKRRPPGEKEDDVCQTLVQEVKKNLYE